MNIQTNTASAEKLPHKHKYIFPNFLAKAMATVDPKTQYESAMLSSFLILIGIIATSIVMIFFMDLTLLYKILIGLNCLGGFLYISSSLVTVYQQYSNYMDIMEIQKSMIAANKPAGIINIQPKNSTKKQYNRKNQALFGLGILSVVFSILLFIPQIANILPNSKSWSIYVATGLFILGVSLIGFIIKKGRDKMKKQIIIEKLIQEGKIKSKMDTSIQIPIQNNIQKPTTILKSLIEKIKEAKVKKQEEEEKKLTNQLQSTLDEIKRLKISERRSNNSIAQYGR